MVKVARRSGARRHWRGLPCPGVERPVDRGSSDLGETEIPGPAIVAQSREGLVHLDPGPPADYSFGLFDQKRLSRACVSCSLTSLVSPAARCWTTMMAARSADPRATKFAT